MNDLLELQFRATRLVHWPTGPTYACDYQAEALQKIAPSMKLRVADEELVKLIDSQSVGGSEIRG